MSKQVRMKEEFEAISSLPPHENIPTQQNRQTKSHVLLNHLSENHCMLLDTQPIYIYM